MVPANLRRRNNFSPGSNLRRREESTAEADWSQLPSEILQLISQKLNKTEIYLIRFRSVCSAWRRSTSIPNHPRNYSLPMLPNSRDLDCCLSKQSIFLIKPPNQQQTPWLIRIGPDIYGKSQLWHPLDLYQSSPSCFHDVIDFNKLSVFHLGHVYFIHHRYLRQYRHMHYAKVVAATSDGGQPIAFLTFDYNTRRMIFNCGEDSWNNLPAMSMPSFGDICVFKARLCVTDRDGRTVIIGPNSSVQLLANPVSGGDKKFLVESECELLLVDTYKFGCEGDDPSRIDVFKLDEKEKNWVRLTGLGNRVLFLGGDYSFLVSASDLCVTNGNCVIYRRSYAYNLNAMEFGTRMRIFHLDQGRVSPLSDYPDYFKLFRPPPEWIVRRNS